MNGPNILSFFHTLGLLVPLTKYRLSTDQLLKKSIDNFSVKTKLKAPSKNLHESHYTIEPIFADVSHMDPFLTTKSVCQLIEKDVMAVVGVHLGTLDQQIASILSYVGIPFLQINPSFQWENAITKYNSSLNLYPSRKILAQVSYNTLLITSSLTWLDCCLKVHFRKNTNKIITLLNTFVILTFEM